MPIVNLSISVEKYLKEIEGAIPKKWQSKASLVSKGTSISSISARLKLAERKAKLEAEKVYSKRLTELEEQELAYKRNKRKIEMEKMEIEHTTLETELNKLDDLADKLENFDKKVNI